MGVTAWIGAGITLWADPATPLTPDGEQGRRLAEHELSKPVYQAAEPTVVDRIARAVAQFFADLFNVQLGQGWGSAFAVIAAIVVVILIVVAFIVWGAPRAVHRAPASPDALFTADDTRSAAELRAAAASRAADAEWDAAIILRFRALARGCAERGTVDTPPGATVHAFAHTAARAFPSSADDLEHAATVFDDIRYLRRPGTAELYGYVAAVDDRIVATRPVDPGRVGASA